jgi:hypothetical protein
MVNMDIKKYPETIEIGIATFKRRIMDSGHLEYLYYFNDGVDFISCWYEMNSKDINIVVKGYFWATVGFFTKLEKELKRIGKIYNENK